MDKVKVINLKDCEGDVNQINDLLNEEIDSLRFYDAISVVVSSDKNIATLGLRIKEGYYHIVHLHELADKKEDNNVPASMDFLFSEAVGVLVNRCHETIKICIPIEISKDVYRWNEYLPILLNIAKILDKNIEVISLFSKTNLKIFKKLVEEHPNLKIFILDESKRKKNIDDEEIPCFTVADSGYWLETEKKLFGGRYHAVVNFGDDEGRDRLQRCFEILKTKSNLFSPIDFIQKTGVITSLFKRIKELFIGRISAPSA